MTQILQHFLWFQLWYFAHCACCFFIFVGGLSHKSRWYFTIKISSILSCLTCQFSCLSNYLKSFHSTIALVTVDDTVFFVVALEVVLCAVILLNTIPLSMLNSNSQLHLLHPLFVLSISHWTSMYLLSSISLLPFTSSLYFMTADFLFKISINLSSVGSSSSWSVLTKYLTLFKSVLLVKLVQIHSLLTRCFLSHSWIDIWT